MEDYRVDFTYSENVLKGMKKIKYEQYFTDAYNKATELANERYEMWNEDYIKMYPEQIENGKIDDNIYNKYISEKKQELFTKLNYILDYPVKVWTDDEANTIGRFMYKGKQITMSHIMTAV